MTIVEKIKSLATNTSTLAAAIGHDMQQVLNDVVELEEKVKALEANPSDGGGGQSGTTDKAPVRYRLKKDTSYLYPNLFEHDEDCNIDFIFTSKYTGFITVRIKDGGYNATECYASLDVYATQKMLEATTFGLSPLVVPLHFEKTGKPAGKVHFDQYGNIGIQTEKSAGDYLVGSVPFSYNEKGGYISSFMSAMEKVEMH